MISLNKMRKNNFTQFFFLSKEILIARCIVKVYLFMFKQTKCHDNNDKLLTTYLRSTGKFKYFSSVSGC